MAGDAIEALLAEELKDGGIKPMPETGEGKLVRVERAGQFGWAARKSNPRTGAYFYFDVEPRKFTRWADERALVVQLTYFDGGKGSFSLVYDSFDRSFRASPAVPPGAWKPALQVQLKNTGKWVVAEGDLPFPYFQNRLNGYDLRINPPGRNEEFAVQRLAIVRTDRPAEQLPAVATLPVALAESDVLSVEGSYVRQRSSFLPDGDGNIWIEPEEAEVLQMKAGQTVGVDPGASADVYVHHVEAMQVRFVVEKEGTYQAWERGLFPHAGNWNHSEHMAEGEGHIVSDHRGASDGWVWVKGPRYDLKAGENVWVFDNYLAGARLDKLLLTPDEAYKPQGKGGEPRRLDAPGNAYVITSPLKPLDVSRWSRLAGGLATRGGSITIQYQTAPDGQWKALPEGDSLKEVPVQGGGKDWLRFRFLLQASPAGALPCVQGLKVAFVPGPGDSLELRNEQIAMRFNSAGLESIVDAQSGTHFTKEGVQSPLFELSVKQPGPHTPTTLPFSAAILQERERQENGLCLRYRYPQGIGVDFIARFNPDGTCTWSLAIDNQSALEVCAVGFPRINGLRVGPGYADDTLLWPQSWVQIVRNPVETNVPSNLGLMLRFMDLWDKEAGFYLANYDRELYHTSYTCPNYDATSLAASWTRYVTVKPGGRFEGLQVCLGAHRGDWHWAADRYREWAQSWMSKPPNPPWTVECHGWSTYPSNLLPCEGFDFYSKFRQWKEIGLGRYLGANRVQLDGPINYVGTMHGTCPLWGTEEQFRDQCEDIREHGGHVNTYFNWYRFSPAKVADKRLAGFCPRSWMPPDVTYPTVEWYKENTLRGYLGESPPVGNIRTEIAMCPGSKGWREYQFQWLRRYVENYLCDGMYYDQIMHAPGTCKWLGHQHANVGDFRRASIQTLHEMNEMMRKRNPHFANSGELASGVMGQEIQFHMVSGVLNRTEVFRYTFPDYLLLDGGWNGGTAEYFGGEDRYHHIFITGCRFEQVPRNEFGRRMVALRQKTGQMLYRAQFLDTVGLTILDPEGKEIANPPRTKDVGTEIAPVGGLQAKLFRYTDRNNRALLVNVTNKPGLEGTIRVKTEDIGQVKAAWLFTLDGAFTRLQGENTPEGYVFEAPKARLATAVLVNRLEPVVYVDMPVPHVAGARVEARAEVLNLNDSPLEGKLAWELPPGWPGGDPRPFGPVAPGQKQSVSLGFDVPEDAPRGRPFVFLEVWGANETGVRKFVPFAVVEPLRVYVHEPGDWTLVAEVENRGTSELSGQVKVDAPEGLMKGPVVRQFQVKPRQMAQLTFEFDPVRRTAVHGRLDIEVTAASGNLSHTRSFRVMPTIPNPSFDEDSAGDRRPDYWKGSENAYAGPSRFWKQIHLDGEVKTDGPYSVRLDPHPEAKNITLYNLVGRFPGGPGKFRFSADVRRAGEGTARIRINAPISGARTFNIPAQTGVWHTLSADWELTKPAASGLNVMLENLTQSPIWVDNIRLEYVP